MLFLIPNSCKEEEENAVTELLNQMTLEEKIGQMSQIHGENGHNNPDIIQLIKDGQIGSILNESNPKNINAIQKIAVEESRLGIPLIFARDVIHGFKSIFPVNIGLASSFDPELVEKCAEVWGNEARNSGIRWSFAPMADISRDPRWGRMAEGYGEDPLLVSKLSIANMKGFQSTDTSGFLNIAACAKHFAGYGAVEGGRDYHTVDISPVRLHNIHLKPFRDLKKAGVRTYMSAFNELNGIPATGNKWLLKDILRDTWGFDGFVVSDWASITEQITHGYATDNKDAAYKAFSAGLDMEMATSSYRDHLIELLKEGRISETDIDNSVRAILQLKFDLGLFENPYCEENIELVNDNHLELAKTAAIESAVLLKNDGILPLNTNIKNLAVCGPLANDRYEQLGTWIFDGDTNLSITPLKALNESLGENRVKYSRILKTSRDHSLKDVKKALKAFKGTDTLVFFAGEESILTGEAHSRAYLDFPGAQNELIKELHANGKKIILVVMTSRPIILTDLLPHVEAVLYAWHPGTMAGPAITDLLFGKVSPSGKLPVSFPVAEGQIPVYYAQKNSGRPADENSWVKIDDIPIRSFQTSLGNTNHYLDVGYKPLFPFGYGLSYTTLEYGDVTLSSSEMNIDGTIEASISIKNTGKFDAKETVQLYIQDITASVTRPVRELKDFKKVAINKGNEQVVSFTITSEMLEFYDGKGKIHLEPGDFNIWIGPDSETNNKSAFTLTK
jgi:beta-glucosidase